MTVVVAVGEMNRRVKLQQRSSSTDTFGQQSTTWSDLATVWARIEPVSSREYYGAQAVQVEITHRITLRYRSELADPRAAAALRVLWGSRIFNLRGPLNVDLRSRFVEIDASEGLNDG